VIDVAVGRDTVNPITLTPLEIPPVGSVLNAFAWCATSLVIGLVVAAQHVMPPCLPSPKVLLSIAVFNFVTVCPAFSYMAEFTLTYDGVRVELSPSFTWGPGMNLGAALALLVLIIHDITLLQAAPGATSVSVTKNADIEASGGDAGDVAATKAKATIMAVAKCKKAPPANAKKPAPRYNADVVSAA